MGRIDITPAVPFWLSGYAARTNAATNVLTTLWAKALAVEDSQGHRAVVVTTDLIGLPRLISESVAAQARQRYGLRRSQLLLNSSHTHCGPAVRSNLVVMFDLNRQDQQAVERYADRLTQALVTVAGAALSDLAPGELALGHGSVGFAVNRRQLADAGVQIGYNPNGPVDHAVPVLRINRSDGQLLAVLFGYACHNTTLGGDFYQVNGDYAGFAQAEFEREHPGTTALFVMLCGGDQNPRPRGTPELAVQHGHALATEVSRVLTTELAPVTPPIRTEFREVSLKFAPHDRAQFEREAQDPDKFRQRRAALMLAAYDRRRPVRSVDYPVQVIRLGQSLTLVGMAGEVVVDYGLRLKREYPQANLITLGYCNDVMCYIPSLRVLREGGYEPVTSMIYYAQPGPFREDVEDRVHRGLTRALKGVGLRPGMP